MKNIEGKTIIIGPSSFAEADRSPLDRLLATGFRVIANPYKRKMTKEELQALFTEDVIGILAGLEPIDREVLSKSHLKVISRVGAGLSNVDLDAARELGIAVFNTPDSPTNAVAELTVGALLNLLRRIHQSNLAIHQRKWDRKIGSELGGKMVAIVGFGRIGRRVAELLMPFRARLLAVDPNLMKTEDIPCPLLSLEIALPQVDIITIHASGNVCLLDEKEFSLMKRGVFILNAARGSVVSEKALIKALDEGVVAGAWLDTFEEEPYEGPLCDYDNVILTPHIGSFTAECRRCMENEAVSNLLQALGK